jgi:anti-sigma regulatory factor (Ser/Thr protein kinase)
VEVTSGFAVTVTDPSQVSEARRRGAEAASALQLDEITAGRAAIVITEAATNLLKHGGGGEVFVGPAGGGSTRGLQVIALDKGRGIANVTASLQDGISTTGTAGTGLGAIVRASTSFDVYTAPGAGTVIAATVYANGSAPLAPAGVSVPMPGETRCGDGWASWSAGELVSIFLCDGLGHGPEAAHATDLATEAFRQHAELPTREIIEYVFAALKPSRGAAVAVAELDRREGRARFCGLGNIAGAIVRSDGTSHSLVSHPGIAGHTMRRLQEFTYEWPAGSLIVLHSDGLTTHWSLERYAGLHSRHPDVIAGVLYRDFRRLRDDATVVVARNGLPA